MNDSAVSFGAVAWRHSNGEQIDDGGALDVSSHIGEAAEILEEDAVVATVMDKYRFTILSDKDRKEPGAVAVLDRVDFTVVARTHAGIHFLRQAVDTAKEISAAHGHTWKQETRDYFAKAITDAETVLGRTA